MSSVIAKTSCCREETGVYNAGDSEGAPDYCTHSGEEVVEGLVLEDVLDCYGGQLIPEPDRRQHTHTVRIRLERLKKTYSSTSICNVIALTKHC